MQENVMHIVASFTRGRERERERGREGGREGEGLRCWG